MATTVPVPGESLTNPLVEAGSLSISAATGASLGYLPGLALERDLRRFLYQDAVASHQHGLEEDLRRRTVTKARADVPGLLVELAEQRGLAWATIASVVGVSVSALRKWRHGGKATADNRRALAQLAALLDLMDEYQVNDPASWLEMPLPLGAGHRVRPLDLYRGGHITGLLELASGRENDPARVLDHVRPGWRDQRSEWEVVDAPDGVKAIQRREQ